MNLFPLFLKLRGRKCLVVGAGKISEGKIAGLLAAGAKVTVVAPSATDKIQAWRRAKKIVWKKKAYAPGDLRGALLVVASTSSPKVHRRIFRDAQELGVLCNIVDVPDLCDFYYPSVVRRGELQIAISTAGASPSLAKRLRQRFEREFGPEYAQWLRELRRKRQEIRARKLPLEEQHRLLDEIAGEAALQEFLRGRRPGP